MSSSSNHPMDRWAEINGRVRELRSVMPEERDYWLAHEIDDVHNEIKAVRAVLRSVFIVLVTTLITILTGLAQYIITL